MIINPAIIALIGGSLLTVGIAVYASVLGLQIDRRWDLSSGSRLQLQLERRTYLIATIMSWLLSIEIFSLFLLVYTADHLHPMFVGAMCAAGTFNANGYGYPALMLKIVSVIGGGLWLIINQADSQAADYPLIRFKYRLMAGITVVMTAGALMMILYFKGLAANLITSCCGALFSTEARSIAGEIAGLPVGATRGVFFVCAALHLRSGVHLLATGRGGRWLGWISGAYFIVGMASVITFISVYYYQLPTHHCPFDILQADYHYVGYPLYAGLFGLAITGMGVGVLSRFAAIPSLTAIVPRLQRQYAATGLACGFVVVVLAAYPMLFSSFSLPSG